MLSFLRTKQPTACCRSWLESAAKTPPGSKKPESRPEHGVLEVSSGWGDPYLLDGRKLRHPTFANCRRRDYLSGGQRAEILPLRRRLLFNRLVRVKQQRILSPRGLVHERKLRAEPVAHRLYCEARGRSARAKVQLRTSRRCGGELRRKPSVRCASPTALGRLAADK